MEEYGKKSDKEYRLGLTELMLEHGSIEQAGSRGKASQNKVLPRTFLHWL